MWNHTQIEIGAKGSGRQDFPAKISDVAPPKGSRLHPAPAQIGVQCYYHPEEVPKVQSTGSQKIIKGARSALPAE